MTSPVRFSKLHATGNDFLVVDASARPALVDELGGPLATRLCDRHTGIGADGLLVLLPGGDTSDATMVLFNADGGRAEMSGNGIRCLAWVARRAGVGHDGAIVVDTDAGRRTVRFDDDGRADRGVAHVDMGAATFAPAEIPVEAATSLRLGAQVDGVTYDADAAGMGNPHLVLYVDDPASAPVREHGARLEHDPRFPQRTNVEFVRLSGPDRLTMRVWERGVGETLSCGTGACAVAAAAHRRGLVGPDVTVDVPGGSLRIHLGDVVTLGGTVVHVFDTTLDLEEVIR